MNNKRWTLNADVGEGCDDNVIMPFLDRANICCGEHAGDTEITEKTIHLAEHHNVLVGAHPGYPDRENFGRISLPMSNTQLQETLLQQIQLVDQLSTACTYVKPHGALNHDMLANNDIFETICKVTQQVNPKLELMLPTNANYAKQISIAQEYDLHVCWEVFADRAYEANGLLRARKHADAVHQDPQVIAEQIKHITSQQSIIAINGSTIDVSMAETICIHGDNQASITAITQLGT